MSGGPSLQSRALGAYLGLAVGDALGATVEFLTPNEIRYQYGELSDIVGGGWLKLKPGQVTDDTQMSLAMSAAIIEVGGWNLSRIADHWGRWLKSKPIDVGNTCRRGLTRYLRDGSLEAPFSDGDAGNGALMRNLPAVLLAFRDPDLLDRYSLEQARVTHHHPFSDAATVCFARMMAALLSDEGTGDTEPQRIKHNLRKTRDIAAALVEQHRQFRYQPYPKRATAYVIDTAQTVLHHFFSTDSFESCLIATVNQGGDADTTGAIAGMLAGAHYGVEAIPGRWLKRLDPATRRVIETHTPVLLAIESG